MPKAVKYNALAEAQKTQPARESDDEERISVREAVARICMLIGLLVLVNILPEGLGVSLTRTDAGQWIVRPALRASSSLLNLWLSLSLALWVVNLYYGRWLRATRAVDLGLSVLGLLVLLHLLKRVLPAVSEVRAVLPPGHPQTALAQIGENPGAWATLAASILLPVALLCTLWESARRLVAMARLKCEAKV